MKSKIIIGIFCAISALSLIASHAYALATNYITYSSLSQPPTIDIDGPLALGNDGNFYGLDMLGGINYAGSVFRLTPTGDYTLLHSMNGSDGYLPVGGLVNYKGILYGTSQMGGAHGYGNVFTVTNNGSINTIFSFNNADGNSPVHAPITKDGVRFIGGAYGGGTNGYGTFYCFSNNPVVWSTSLNEATGYYPAGRPAWWTDGYIYATTAYGGNGGSGNIGRLNPTNGAWTPLVSFNGGSSTGGNPETALVLGTDNCLYGTTWGGYDQGTVFRFNPATTNITIVHVFYDSQSQDYPQDLVVGPDGAIYGTTAYGGAYGGGMAFRIGTNGSFTSLLSFPSPVKYANGPVFGADNIMYSTVKGNSNFFRLAIPMPVGLYPPIGLTNKVLVPAYVVPGYSYQFQSNTNLANAGSWADIGSPVIPTNAMVGFIDPNTNMPNFYRIKQYVDPAYINVGGLTHDSILLPLDPYGSYSGNWTGFPVPPAPPSNTNGVPWTNGPPIP